MVAIRSLRAFARRNHGCSAFIRMASTTPSAAPKILISGAGVAGPCLAYWLSRTRLRPSITILERSAVPRPTGQAIDIREQAVDVITRMGLLDQVKERHTTETGTIFLNSRGKPLAKFIGDGEFTAEFEILRADLAEILMEATEKLPGVTYRFGDYVSGIKQDEKAAEVTFANGGKEKFDLVVAADGARSKIRDMVLDKAVTSKCYKFIGQYCGYFSIPKTDRDDKNWYWYSQPGLGSMLRPHRNEQTMGAYLIITTPKWGHEYPDVEEAMEKGVESQKQVLHRYFANHGWEAARILKGMDIASDFYMSRSATVTLPTWHSGRTVLLGDAAWATFGVATSLAINGSYFLAGELSKISSTNEIPQALNRYEDSFRPIYEPMAGLPSGYPQLAFPQTRLGMGIRDALLWSVNRTGVWKLFRGVGNKAKWKLPEYEWLDARA